MKKFVELCCIAIMLFGMVAFTFSADEGGPDTSYNGNEGGSGSGGSVLWIRTDILCPDKSTEKTTCAIGGTEQCTAQYCNF